ncbi:hypothetical protein N9937_01435 [bacterium]|nr:hypothetical protein [bacterium]
MPSVFSASEVVQKLGDLVQKRFAYVGSTTNIEYIGLAEPGTLEAAAGWSIQKLTYVNSNVTAVDFASDDVTADKIWDDRATYF